MKTLLKKLLGDKAGASAAEYALILAVVGGGIVAAMGGLGTAISETVDGAADSVSAVDVAAD
jgi:pilus assembly protein Flp/PilA